MSCAFIQDDLYNYLKTELDPYDFNMYLADFARDIGIPKIDEDSCVSELDDEQMEQFKKWLEDENKAEEFVREDPMYAPAYLLLRAQKKLPPGSWLVHFTNHVFDDFTVGATIDNLALSVWTEKKAQVNCEVNLTDQIGLHEVVFGFAFDANESHLLHKGKKYGRNAVLFRSDCAVVAWHYGDEENQAIFPLCSEYDVVILENVRDGISIDEREFRTFPEAIRYIEGKR
jgi:hypothetical protein